MYLTRRNSRLIAGIVLVTFFTSSILIIRSHTRSPHPSPQADSSSPNSTNQEARVVLKNFRRSETQGDRKLWEIEAEEGELTPSTGSVRLMAPHMTLFREDGTTVVVTAPSGLLTLHNSSLQEADLSGGVRVDYGDNCTIETQRAIYSQNTGKVLAPGFTVIKNDTITISGDSLEADVTIKKLLLRQNVKTVIEPRHENSKKQ